MPTEVLINNFQAGNRNFNQLTNILESFGRVYDIVVSKNRIRGAQKYQQLDKIRVIYEQRSDALEAIKNLNHSIWNGRVLDLYMENNKKVNFE